MKLASAIELIRNEHLSQQPNAVWADLGCGSGLFTFALAHLLGDGSTIYGVDQQPVRLDALSKPKGVEIKGLQLDFVAQPLPFQHLDGVLMANSLHYVLDKNALLDRLAVCMKPDGRFLIVEYDTDRPVGQWVPYPISFQSLQQLFWSQGYVAERVGERASVFGRANLYVAWVSRIGAA